MHVGQTAVLTRPDSKDEVEGKVTVVSPAADPNTTTVQIWIEVANPEERLKPGTSVHAAISTEVYKAATVVPAAAILPGEEGGTAVLTISPDSIAHKRTVTLGVRERNQVQILTGVNPGEEVVVVGGMGLDDNTKVKIVTTAVEESDDEDDQNAPACPGPKDERQKKSGEPEMSDRSIAPPGANQDCFPLDCAARQIHHLRDSYLSGRRHLSGSLHSSLCLPQH